MGQSRVPVKGVGYLAKDRHGHPPLWGSPNVYRVPKSFFQVAVGGKLSVEILPTQTYNKGGLYPTRPDNPNNCSYCLGYLPKKKRAMPALNFMRCPIAARIFYFANAQIRYRLSLPKYLGCQCDFREVMLRR